MFNSLYELKRCDVIVLFMVIFASLTGSWKGSSLRFARESAEMVMIERSKSVFIVNLRVQSGVLPLHPIVLNSCQQLSV